MKIVSENRFSGKTYFFTTVSRDQFSETVNREMEARFGLKFRDEAELSQGGNSTAQRTFYVYLHRFFGWFLKDVEGGENVRKEGYVHQNRGQFFLVLTDSKILHLFWCA